MLKDNKIEYKFLNALKDLIDEITNVIKNNNKVYNPYILAEAGVNHEGDINKAIHLIDLAADGGAHGIKFQTYKADKIAAKKSPYYWDLKSLKKLSHNIYYLKNMINFGKKNMKFWQTTV